MCGAKDKVLGLVDEVYALPPQEAAVVGIFVEEAVMAPPSAPAEHLIVPDCTA